MIIVISHDASMHCAYLLISTNYCWKHLTCWKIHSRCNALSNYMLTAPLTFASKRESSSSNQAAIFINSALQMQYCNLMAV